MLGIHRRIAKSALAVAADSGFALAGGYALVMHGLSERPSADVDLFTNSPDVGSFQATVGRVLQALVDDGLEVHVHRSSGTFAEVGVREPESSTETFFQMGADYRAEAPVVFDVGPVLSVQDAAANKLCAMYSRGETRDFIDVHLVLAAGRFTRSELLSLADSREALPLDRGMLARRCAEGARLDEGDARRYDRDDVADIRSTFRSWATELSNSLSTTDQP